MPIYEFECDKCKLRFELRRTISEMESDAMCPSCSSSNTYRKFPTAFAHFSTNKTRSFGNVNRRHNLIINDARVENCGGLIAGKNISMRGKNIRMKDTRGTAIDVEDSDIDIEDLVIE